MRVKFEKAPTTICSVYMFERCLGIPVCLEQTAHCIVHTFFFVHKKISYLSATSATPMNKWEELSPHDKGTDNSDVKRFWSCYTY